VGYYRNFTLWHNGSNPWGCSNYQDDLAIITNKTNGIGFRTDDYTNGLNGGATRANFVNSRFAIDGVIENVADKDVFQFTMPVQGIFHLDANPYNVGSGDNGSNLDMKIELWTNKRLLGTYNPDMLLNATIDTILDASTYFLLVQSSGNAYAPDYASLGSYALSASYEPVTVLPVHRLQLQGSSGNGGVHKLDWIIEADESITSQTLEVSFDGKNFQVLNAIKPVVRTYQYIPTDRNILYYRLKVNFNNNRQYYSNIVALRNSTIKPSLLNTVVSNSLQINSPSSFRYVVADYSGRSVAKGILSAGNMSINTTNLSSGMYVIQFTNGQEQYAEKFMKQSNY
jgi:hypothetical protein